MCTSRNTTEIVSTGRDAFCRYCSYASITLIRSRVRAVARLSRIRHPLYFDAPNHNATVQPKQEKYGMRVRCMGTYAVFLFEKLPTLICDA